MAKMIKQGEFKTEILKSWEDFEEKVATPSLHVEHDVYFRGQPDATWHLESSLYRKKSTLDINAYLNCAYGAFKMLQSMTEDKWKLSIDDFKKLEWFTIFDILESGEPDESLLRKQEPLFEFLTYLRHYGYPTPLIDWTKSPYVALFFACHENWKSKDVAIFKYQKSSNGVTLSIKPYKVEIYDHPIKTHARHYLQHSAYMIAVKNVSRVDMVISIEEAIFMSSLESRGQQDIVCKYLIPSNKRIEFLKRLDQMNINHMTLFSDKASMIQTLTMRHFDFDED